MNASNREIARQAAKETVAEYFNILGVDINDPEERRSLQADHAYLRRSRQGAEEIAKIVRRSAITLALGGFAWVLWEGFKIAVRAKVGG